MPIDFLHLWDYRIQNPFIRTLKLFTADTISFDGYFYLEDDTMPVERILINDDAWQHIEIYEKKTVEDTSIQTTQTTPSNDEGDDICFFPTAIIHLKYRVIKLLNTTEESERAKERIGKLEDAVQMRDQPLRTKRLEREHADLIERCRTMDFKGFLSRTTK
jgi:hypothetical protein